MVFAALIGLLASGVVGLSRYLYSIVPSLSWYSPAFLLGVGAVALLLQRFVLNRDSDDQNYNGLPDLILQIHSPQHLDLGLKWLVRGWISFLLTLFGGVVGPEGAAIEWAEAMSMRLGPRSSRWFEQKRRTLTAVSIASGISAAFKAPFTAVILTMELGIGGKSILSVIGALFAWKGIQVLTDQFSLPYFELPAPSVYFHWTDWREWAVLVFIGISTGFFSGIVIRFVRYVQESFLSLFQTKAWIRTLAGAVLLYLVFYIVKKAHQPSIFLLEQVFWNKYSPQETAFMLVSGLLSFALFLSAFGTLGIFWPIFLLGGTFGFCIYQMMIKDVVEMSAIVGFAGASALWASVLGAPLSGAVLAFELTQNTEVLFPCLLAGVIALKCREWMRTQSLLHEDLNGRGVSLTDGKLTSVLDKLTVQEAMVSDYEMVHEQEPISELQVKLMKSPYPFLPVVNTQGKFMGLLTVDMLKQGWNVKQYSPGSNQFSLENLLEAKDILYKNGVKSPTVKPNDRLSSIGRLFDEIPCVPVVADDDRVVGLLFIYQVRAIYEREVARRSFFFMRLSER